MMLLRIAVVLSVALLMVHALNSALIGQKRMSKFALHSSTFRSSFGSDIPDWLHANLEKLGYSEPTVAQQESLPLIFQGEDVILQSQTGSGKTLAYSLPILSQIDTSRSAIQAVIVVPTRELGMQVSAVLKQLSSGAPEKVMIMVREYVVCLELWL
jgi:superfamily II DNA/RNA helicase